MDQGYRLARLAQRIVQRQAAARPMAELYGVVQQPLDELVYRISSGRITASGWLSGLEIAMLTTTGAKTGTPRTVPVLPLPDGDRTILIASNFGRPTTRPGTTTCAPTRAQRSSSAASPAR